MNLIQAGRTIMLAPARSGKTHLFVILTDPDPVTNKVVSVMLVSEKPTTDKTVTLTAGDHPFVVRPTNVDYRTTTLFPVSNLERVIRSREGVLREDLSGKLLEIVRAGVFASSYTPNDMKDHCRTRFDEKGKTVTAKQGPRPP